MTFEYSITPPQIEFLVKYINRHSSANVKTDRATWFRTLGLIAAFYIYSDGHRPIQWR